jgi:plasmid stability protein
MPVMLQVRNLPDEVHQRLKERASEARMSLSDYVADQLAQHVAYRSNRQIIEDFHRRHPDIPAADESAADTIRAARDENDATFDRAAAETAESEDATSMRSS